MENQQKNQISKITRTDLFKILQLSEEGINDIVKLPGKSSTEEALKYMELLSFNGALNFIISHPYVLQASIIMNEHSYLWSHTIKVDTNWCVIICLRRHKNERTFRSGFKRYDEELKQTIKQWIDYYNTKRVKKKLGWLSPIEYRLKNDTITKSPSNNFA